MKINSLQLKKYSIDLARAAEAKEKADGQY